MSRLLSRLNLSSSQIIIIGFALLILCGAALLMLPIATVSEESACFLDALFTATSAVCVTGLVVHNTATYWTLFGQAVILVLIQIGGMGIVTVVVSISMAAGRRIGLMQRSTLQDALSAHHVGGIVKLTGFILKVTFAVEMIGAMILGFHFQQDFGWLRGMWYGLFHSVSAFCNAGFDLLGEQIPYASLTGYAASPVVNIVVMLLIVIGGIGFLTWDDVRINRYHIWQYRMQSKAILLSTVVLIVLPAAFFYFGELALPQWSHLTEAERFWGSLFQSVTPRTAGFNTLDIASMSGVSQFLTLMLMLVGGAPGSTAGGMKTTTVVVLICSVISVCRRKESIRCFNRRLDDDTVRHAAAILMLYLTFFIAGGLCISWMENLPVMTCLFETASAIGTVGLTLGITPGLGSGSRVILILLMFFGRVGGLTLIFATASGKAAHAGMLPKEKIIVG